MKLRTIISILITLTITLSLQAQVAGDKAKSKRKDGNQGDSPALVKTNLDLDKKIQKINNRLAVFYELLKRTVKYSPTQTTYEMNEAENSIMLKSYNYIPKGNSNVADGLREKSVKLFFEGEKLTKVESNTVRVNFREQIQHESSVVDPTPTGSEGTEDITMRTITKNTDDFIIEDAYTVKVGAMDNTNVSPFQIKFKRDYYIPNLIYFENLFRHTLEYDNRFGTDNDAVTIKALKKTLDY